MKFRILTSEGSILSSLATRSIIRSIMKRCGARANPLFGPAGHLFVNTAYISFWIFLILYAPGTTCAHTVNPAGSWRAKAPSSSMLFIFNPVFNVEDSFSAMTRSQKMLRPRLDPTYRPSDLHRSERDQNHIHIVCDFAPKSSSNVHRDETHLIIWKTESTVELRKHEGRLLVVAPNSQVFLARIVICYDCVRFKRSGAESVKMNLFVKNSIGLTDCSIDISVVVEDMSHDVCSNFLMYKHFFGIESFLGVNYRFEPFIFYRNGLDRIFGDVS